MENAATPPPTAPDLATPEKPKDLDDPQVQHEILNPPTMRYTLKLDGGERLIEVKTAPTIHDINSKRVYEDAEALRQTLMYEIAKVDPDAAALGQIKIELFLIGVARSTVRDQARSLLCKMATLVEPVGGRDRPTANEVALGMDPIDLNTFVLWAIQWVANEVERQKNARRTAE